MTIKKKSNSYDNVFLFKKRWNDVIIAKNTVGCPCSNRPLDEYVTNEFNKYKWHLVPAVVGFPIIKWITFEFSQSNDAMNVWLIAFLIRRKSNFDEYFVKIPKPKLVS